MTYTGSDKVKAEIIRRLNEGGGGGGGSVDDVKVIDADHPQGQSVVTSGVANIDLTAYATALYVSGEIAAALQSYYDATYIDGHFYDKTTMNSKLSDKADTSSLATVATSGRYNDLSGLPTIPAAQVQSDYGQTDSTAVDFIKNKPAIPTVNDGTLTLKNGDQIKGTFTANQSTAANVVMLPFDITGNTTIGFTPVYPS